jgi:putative ABC transport system permease protein
MTGSRWRKVRADLSSSKLRSILAIVSLTVGTTAVGAMMLAGSILDASFDASLLDANPPSATLATGPFGAATVHDVVAHPSIGQAEGRRTHRTQLAGPDGTLVGVELVAMVDFTDNHIARVEPVEGAWPPQPGQIVFERASIGELGATVGDAVQVEAPGEQPVALAVAGTTFDVSEIAPMFGGSVRGYVAMDTMAELTGSDHLDTLYLRAASEPLDDDVASEAAAAVRDDVLRPAGVAVAANLVPDPGVHPAVDATSFIVRAMQLLSLLALAIAIGLVLNTVTALLAQQRRQLGVMKSMGATVGQLTVQYLAYVGLLSMGAIALSIPGALVGARTVAGAIAWLANLELVSVGAPVRIFALQVVIATLLPIGAVVFAVRRACRITVREAITERGLAGPSRVRRTASRLSRPNLLAYRNAVRNRPRLGLTVLTVALCGGVLVGVASAGSSLFGLADEVAGYADYDVELAVTEPLVVADVTEVLAADPEVVSVEGWWHTEAFLLRADGTENDDLSITAAPTGSASIEPTLLEGRWYGASDTHAIVINANLAEAEPDLAVGGELLLEIDGHRQRWQIVGIATTTTVGPVAYVPADELADTVGQPGRANVFAMQLAADVDHGEAADRLGASARDAGLPVGQLQTNAQLREGFEGIVTIAIALLLFIGAILGVVAIIGVAGTMTLGVFEQTREIGVLRTLGATTWAVRRLLLLQGVTVAGVGGLFGIVLSLPVAWLLGSAMEATVIAPAQLPTGFSWLAVAIWIPAAVAIGALGALQPARIAARLTVRDTLAYE